MGVEAGTGVSAGLDGQRHAGPTWRALVALAVAALAIVATTPPPPTLAAYAITEVLFGGGGAVTRDLRLHLAPSAGQPSSGTITLSFQAAHGLEESWTPDVALALLDDAGEPVTPVTAGGTSYVVPVERCANGCDLAYRLVATPAATVAPGSSVRVEAGARLEYSGGRWFGTGDQGLLSVTVSDAATGPPLVTWSILAAIIAFAAGVLAAGRVGRVLGGSRRTWPARTLLALVVLWMARMLLLELAYLAGAVPLDVLLGQPLGVLLALDPWSLGLLGILAIGLWRGIRRWPEDGGWSAGLAGVATAALGGLWLGWAETTAALVQPLLVAVVLGVPGLLAGIVVGQAWSMGNASRADRAWAAAAVIAHGIVIAGLAFVAVRSASDPFGSGPAGLLALIPAVLVGLAFRRWLGGGRAWLILFDLLIAGAGVLGLLFQPALRGYRLVERVELQDVGIMLAVGAALVALVTATHRMRGPRGDEPPALSVIPDGQDREEGPGVAGAAVPPTR